MNSAADRFGEVCTLAESLGYSVRKRWLDGVGGGKVESAGKKWILVDDMQRPEEQVETVLRVLRSDPRTSAEQRRAA